MAEITVRGISRETYDGFLANAPHSAFHAPGWLDAASTAYGIEFRLLGYFRAEVLIAVTPLMGRRMGPVRLWGSPLRKCGTPPATVFCSPPAHAQLLLPHLQRWVKQQHLGFVQVTVPDAPDAVTDPAQHVEALDNLELSLQQPMEDIWRDLAQQKSAVRKAVRSGVRVHFRCDEKVLVAQQALVDATYGRQGLRPNIPASMYMSLLAHRVDASVRVLTASHAGITIASIWALSDSTKCYYWDAAALAESRELNANHLLVWCLIRWAHKRGLRTLDFVGTSTGGRDGSRPGIGRFKQSMGGRPVSYRLIYWHSPLMRAALTAYRTLSRWRTTTRNLLRHIHVNHA